METKETEKNGHVNDLVMCGLSKHAESVTIFSVS